MRLVVTSDCGTTSHHEVRVAQSLGVDVIITDHHQLDEGLPPAFAVVNPLRPDSVYPFKELCSGGLAYKVAHAYQMKYGGGEVPLDHMLDLVALATVADVVPLREENRVFVREGLAQITRGARCGIRALLRTAGVQNACTTRTLAFRLAPRINAAGRLAHAEAGVRLLTTESESEAAALADELETLNRERQRIEAAIKTEAGETIQAGSLPAAIVLGARHWHVGVVGIVAARLVDRFERPAVVLVVFEDGMHAAWAACRDLLLGCGGHPAAAGLTIRESQIPAFRDRFAQLASEQIENPSESAGLHVDTEINLAELDHRVVSELDLLQP